MVRNQRRMRGAGKRTTARRAATQADMLQRALEWFSKGCDFTKVTLHGNVGWQPVQLIVLAVLWAWSDRSTLTQGFEDARQLAMAMFGDVAVTTYQGFTAALQSYTEK